MWVFFIAFKLTTLSHLNHFLHSKPRCIHHLAAALATTSARSSRVLLCHWGLFFSLIVRASWRYSSTTISGAISLVTNRFTCSELSHLLGEMGPVSSRPAHWTKIHPRARLALLFRAVPHPLLQHTRGQLLCPKPRKGCPHSQVTQQGCRSLPNLSNRMGRSWLLAASLIFSNSFSLNLPAVSIIIWGARQRPGQGKQGACYIPVPFSCPSVRKGGCF